MTSALIRRRGSRREEMTRSVAGKTSIERRTRSTIAENRKFPETKVLTVFQLVRNCIFDFKKLLFPFVDDSDVESGTEGRRKRKRKRRSRWAPDDEKVDLSSAQPTNISAASSPLVGIPVMPPVNTPRRNLPGWALVSYIITNGGNHFNIFSTRRYEWSGN